jgi:hypothetical protein
MEKCPPPTHHHENESATSNSVYQGQSLPNQMKNMQFLRLKRICSDQDDCNERMGEMMNFFRRRGYPETVLNYALIRARAVNRQNALIRRPRAQNTHIRLVMTYHPVNLKHKSVFYNNMHLLEQDEETNGLSNLVLAWRKGPTIRRKLVHSALRPALQITAPSKETHCCGKPRCSTCAHILSATPVILLHNNCNLM